MSQVFALNLPVDHDGGIGYRTPIPAEALGLLDDPRIRDACAVHEDGVPLPSGNALHDAIRSQPGLFSVWEGTIFFSSSDGSDCRTNGRRYELVVPGADILAPRHGLFPLARPFLPDGGHAVAAHLPPSAVAALDTDPLVAAMTTLLEDSAPLAHPGQQHQVIRELGYGRFSVWADRVHFSASDGSDCATNGREYALHIPEPLLARAMARGLETHFASNDTALLRLVEASIFTNNTIANNFFEQCTVALEYLRNRGQRPGSAVVLGCGAHPWAPLRLVAEGFERVVANDLCEVDTAFGAEPFDALLTLLDRVAPPLARRLRDLAVPTADGRIQVAGIEIQGSTPFEELVIAPQSIDLVFSNSVLEHVMDPAAVYAAMAAMLSPRGYAIHRIDLRDHLHFFDPLRFLNMSADEYAAIATENRLRASDHIRLAEAAGLQAEVVGVQALPVSGAVDASRAASTTATPIVIVDSLRDVVPAIDEATQAAMAPEFRQHDRRDLSVLGLTVVLQKPRAATGESPCGAHN